VRGGYAGHGETYVHPDNVLWWSHGGTLHGESQERLRFLRGILEETPGIGLRPAHKGWDLHAAEAEKDAGYLLLYFGFNRPAYRDFHFLREDADYRVEVIDTWEMTVDDRGILHGKFHLSLPGKEYIAVRVRKV